MKIGVQLYSFREYLNDEQEIEKTIKKIAQMGYDYLEYAGSSDYSEFMKIQTCAQKYSIPIYGAHFMPSVLEDEEAILKILKNSQLKYVAIPAMPVEFQNYNGYHEYTQIINKLVSSYKGIIEIYYHNHAFEFGRHKLFKNGFEILQKDAQFKFQIDTHWVHIGGYEVTKFLENTNNVAKSIHIKDIYIINDGQFNVKATDCPIGMGTLELMEIIKISKEKNIEYLTVEQEEFISGNPYEDFEKSLSNIKNLL